MGTKDATVTTRNPCLSHSNREKQNRRYKTNPEESPDTTATKTEGGTRPFNGKKNPKDDEEEDAKVRAYVNGHSQGVKKSIINDSTMQQNDPGVHVSLAEKAKQKDETISPPEMWWRKKR